MLCTSCGQQVPDNEKICPNCGAEITIEEKVNEPEKIVSEKKPKKGKIVLISVIAVLLVGIILAVVFFDSIKGLFVQSPDKQLKQAYTKAIASIITSDNLFAANFDSQTEEPISIDEKGTIKLELPSELLNNDMMDLSSLSSIAIDYTASLDEKGNIAYYTDSIISDVSVGKANIFVDMENKKVIFDVPEVLKEPVYIDLTQEKIPEEIDVKELSEKLIEFFTDEDLYKTIRDICNIALDEIEKTERIEGTYEVLGKQKEAICLRLPISQEALNEASAKIIEAMKTNEYIKNMLIDFYNQFEAAFAESSAEYKSAEEFYTSFQNSLDETLANIAESEATGVVLIVDTWVNKDNDILAVELKDSEEEVSVYIGEIKDEETYDFEFSVNEMEFFALTSTVNEGKYSGTFSLTGEVSEYNYDNGEYETSIKKILDVTFEDVYVDNTNEGSLGGKFTVNLNDEENMTVSLEISAENGKSEIKGSLNQEGMGITISASNEQTEATEIIFPENPVSADLMVVNIVALSAKLAKAGIPEIISQLLLTSVIPTEYTIDYNELDGYKENVENSRFITRGNYRVGTCKTLKGTPTVALFFLDTDYGNWTEDEINEFTANNVTPVLDFLEQSAIEWDGELDFNVVSYATVLTEGITLKYEGTFVKDLDISGSTKDAPDQIARDLGYSSVKEMHEDIKEAGNYEDIIPLVIIDTDGVNYTRHLLGPGELGLNFPYHMEHAIIYRYPLGTEESDRTLSVARSILKLFGAESLQDPDMRFQWALSLFPYDIMNYFGYVDITEATAHYIGWTDKAPRIFYCNEWYQ